jgi:hypothetical protein
MYPTQYPETFWWNGPFAKLFLLRNAIEEYDGLARLCQSSIDCITCEPVCSVGCKKHRERELINEYNSTKKWRGRCKTYGEGYYNGWEYVEDKAGKLFFIQSPNETNVRSMLNFLKFRHPSVIEELKKIQWQAIDILDITDAKLQFFSN